jgi:hypothetical protein
VILPPLVFPGLTDRGARYQKPWNELTELGKLRARPHFLRACSKRSSFIWSVSQSVCAIIIMLFIELDYSRISDAGRPRNRTLLGEDPERKGGGHPGSHDQLLHHPLLLSAEQPYYDQVPMLKTFYGPK